jgi:hypothetical protein
VDGGFIRNAETQKGRPADLDVGDPLPEEVNVLPEPARLLDVPTRGTVTE